jgi:CheY-like chemotaxis protein
VAKILVADDNSNIQKMVSLALKDAGIDVVAVGNGEAAVRKIADVRPDLVLADVFMPVRNGYEVCQFVKTDSSLSHIPVILLVGAFDPLDEQEAQRVGADGVLKKPFIPPDPLISMVKSALQRSGAGQVGVPVPKMAEPEAFGSKEMVTPNHRGVPTVEATQVPESRMGNGPETTNESFVEEVPAKPEPLRIDSDSQPVAFGSLLETPAETTEDDSNFATTTSAEFTMEHDWRDRDGEEAIAEEEDAEPAGWSPGGTGDEEEVPAGKSKRSKSNPNDWRMGGFEQIAAGKSRHTGWEPVEEPASVETVPVSSSRVPETRVAPPAPVEETMPAPSRPPVPDIWAPPVASPVVPPITNEKHSLETATAVEEKTHTATETQPPPERKETKDSWFSVSSSPWEAEIQKASQLASTWDTPAASEACTPRNGTGNGSEVSHETQTVIEEAALPPATVEAIREEAAQAAEDATFILERPEAASSEGNSFYAREEEGVLEPTSPPPTASAPTAPNMDDLVAKVLAKMSPEVLQAVTREILKPVVEAMVQDEMKSKKS